MADVQAILVGEAGHRDSIHIGQVEEPELKPGTVLINVQAASINFPDLLMIDGKYQIRPVPPFVPGKDAAGTVVAVGEGVSDFGPGDRVLVQLPFGAFAKRISAPRDRVYRLPPSLSFVQAAAFGLAYKTAWLALVERGGLKAGETVLVLGAAGGVGLATVQTAKALGARVIAGLTTIDKADAVRAAGADAVAALGSDIEATRQAILAANDGRPVDLVLDVVGGSPFDAALKSLAWGGRLITAGFTSGEIPSVKANYLLIKNIAVLGFSSNSYEDLAPHLVANAFTELFALAERGLLAPVIHRTFPLERFAEALAEVEQRRVIGKVVLTFD